MMLNGMHTQSTIRALSLDHDISRIPAYAAREQKTVIRDLLKEGYFVPCDDPGNGPYAIRLGVEHQKLLIRTGNALDHDLTDHRLALKPYRRIIHDYFLMIRSYDKARRDANRAKLEAIDMGRRGIHNEGADMFQSRLENKIEMDFETARRFFTLICILHADSTSWLARESRNSP